MHSLVVLGPPSEEPPPNVVIEEKAQRNTSPSVGQVVRSPDYASRQKYGDVEVPEEPEAPSEEVEGDGQNSSNQETPQETVIDCTRTVHLLGTEGAPENGSGKEGVGTRTGEPILLVWSANVRDRHLIVEDRGANERRHKGCDHLTIKRDPRRDMDIMGQLEILGKMERMRRGDVSVRLEVIHGGGVARKPEPSEQLRDDVQGDLDIGDGHDDAARNAENDREEDTVQYDGWGGVGGVSPNTSRTERDRDGKDAKVDVLGNLLIAPHKTSVDVFGVSEGGFTLDQVLESSNDLSAVVEVGVGDGRGIHGEEHPIVEGVGSREVRWGVSLVGSLVEEATIVDSIRNVVAGTGVIEHTVRVDGDICGVPGVGVPDSDNDRECEECAEERVEDTVEGIDQRIASNGALVPIPCGERVQTQTTVSTGNGCQVNVIGSDPGCPIEVGHGGDEVVRKPEVDEHGDEAVGEPPHPGNPPTVGRSVGSRVEGPIECDGGQVRGPNGAGWVHEEAAGETSEAVTDKIGREGNEDLIAELASPGLVEVEREVLNPNDVCGVGRRETDVCHDCDDHVLLHVELARVEAPGITEGVKLGDGKDGLEQFTSWVCTETGSGTGKT